MEVITRSPGANAFEWLILRKSGGILGIFCSHGYAHTTPVGRRTLPRSLRGVDLALFSAFRALGLEVSVKPILKNQNSDYGSFWGGIKVTQDDSKGASTAVPDTERIGPRIRRSFLIDFDRTLGNPNLAERSFWPEDGKLWLYIDVETTKCWRRINAAMI